MSKSNQEAIDYFNARYRDSGALAAFGTLYFALGIADFTRADITANEPPIGTGGYARVPIPTTNLEIAAPVLDSGRILITNINTIVGATLSAALNGGLNIGYWGLYDLAVGGVLRRVGALEVPRPFLAGDTITIPAGSLRFYE